MNSAAERAIEFMFEKYGEPLSLADVAESAILSRFHFCRIFRDATGVTPGRFLSAIRIYQAKRMLLNTPMNVTDIAFAVGYNSLGSFSNHFTDSVGISPGRFRRISQGGDIRPKSQRASRGWPVTGMIQPRARYADGHVYLAAFDTPIVQRQPASAVTVDMPDTTEPVPFTLPDVPEGTWFIQAVAVADNNDPEPWTRRTLLVGGFGQVTVTAVTKLPGAIQLRPRKPTDLPILLALPDLEPDSRAGFRAPGRVA